MLHNFVVLKQYDISISPDFQQREIELALHRRTASVMAWSIYGRDVVLFKHLRRQGFFNYSKLCLNNTTPAHPAPFPAMT